MSRLLLTVLVIVTALAAGCTSLPTDQPAVSYDGLHRVTSANFAEVYVKPGVDFSIYRAYALGNCEVAFRRDWMRDQNRDRVALNDRVTQQDVEHIKQWVAADCRKFFLAELLRAPPYRLVESVNQGEAVLLLQPAVIDLDINAPDISSPGMVRTYTTSSGEMTLLLELFDATTGEVLGRIVDRKQDMDDLHLEWTTRVSNRADVDSVLKNWAISLRKDLDKVTRAPAK